MITIHKITRSDIEDVVGVHEKAFKDFFLTDLGYSFLSCYYLAVSKHPESIAYCAKDEKGNILGFATGSKNALGYNMKIVKKNFIQFSLQTIKLILTHPNAIIRLYKNMEKNKHPVDNGDYAELLSIAVLPEVRSLGVGKLLLQQFESCAIENGCKKITLTTDVYNNEAVLAFYNRNGYEVYYEFVTYPNRKMRKLIKNI